MKKPAHLTVKVSRLPHGEGLPLPAYQSDHAAGLDLVAAVPKSTPTVIAPGGTAMVPTGLALELPPGTEAQVRPRSGLAAKFAVTVLNSPGTIDADYRGEVHVLLINHGAHPFAIQRGDRIAQMVIATLAKARLVETKSALSQTRRGGGGFGSTGVAQAREKKPIAPQRKTAKPAPRGRRKPSKA